MATFQQDIEGAIHAVISKRINEITNEEIEKAMARIDSEIKKELGVLTMSIFKMYRVEMHGHEIVIRVENKT